MAHFIKQCKHGIVESRCRCIGPHNVQVVPCMTNNHGVPLNEKCREANLDGLIAEVKTAGESYRDVMDRYGFDLRPVRMDIISHNRWSITYRDIFELNGRFFALEHDQPATEYQEGLDETFVDFYEVTRVSKTVVDYIPIAKAL